MARLPKLKAPPAISRGPRIYQLDKRPESIGPPGQPPPGFVTPKTSATEWPVYWGLARITGYPKPEEIRSFPFVGGPPLWTYQAFADAGNERATNVDFMVYGGFAKAKPIAIRVQTEFFHNYAPITKQFYDRIQRSNLQSGHEVVDIYDQDYMRDPTGAAVIVLLKEAMGIIERPNVITSGRVQRV